MVHFNLYYHLILDLHTHTQTRFHPPNNTYPRSSLKLVVEDPDPLRVSYCSIQWYNYPSEEEHRSNANVSWKAHTDSDVLVPAPLNPSLRGNYKRLLKR